MSCHLVTERARHHYYCCPPSRRQRLLLTRYCCARCPPLAVLICKGSLAPLRQGLGANSTACNGCICTWQLSRNGLPPKSP